MAQRKTSRGRTLRPNSELGRQVYPVSRILRSKRTSRPRGLQLNSGDLPRTLGEWYARNEARMRYLLDEDIRRGAISEDEIALAENQVVAWEFQKRAVQEDLQRSSVRALREAAQVIDDLEDDPDFQDLWGSTKKGILYAWASEFRSTGIPYDFLEKELRLSRRDSETRTVLLTMVAIAELSVKINWLKRQIEMAVKSGAKAKRLRAELPSGPLVSGAAGPRLGFEETYDRSDVSGEILPVVSRIGEKYEESDWDLWSRARKSASDAAHDRRSVLRQVRIDSPIEANRGAIYALPKRKAYPITSREDAINATKRLKQGRVKDEADAKRIIAAIHRKHLDVWREYLEGYPVSRIMRSKRKASRARRAKASRAGRRALK